MEKEIELQGNRIKFLHKFRPRSRSIGITIYRDGRVTVSSAKNLQDDSIFRFIERNGEWILRTLKRFENNIVLPKRDASDREKIKPLLLAKIKERVEHFNQFYGFKYSAISIRNTSSRWGSCSRRGNLNFSYKMFDIPDELFDYVIVHELCHLKEFNHARGFWDLVAVAAPNYAFLRTELKKYV